MNGDLRNSIIAPTQAVRLSYFGLQQVPTTFIRTLSCRQRKFCSHLIGFRALRVAATAAPAINPTKKSSLFEVLQSMSRRSTFLGSAGRRS
jgi:hypothetical protein